MSGRASRVMTLVVGALLFSQVPWASALSQTGGPTAVDFRGAWTWDQLRRIPDVDSSRVAWLEHNIPMAEARELFALVASLTKPEVGQLLPAYVYLDDRRRPPTSRAIMDTLAVRGPGGDVGIVRLAHLVAVLRHQTLEALRKSSYRANFDSADASLPAVVTGGGSTPKGFDLSFDFGPIDTLLAIVSTPDITPEAVIKRISTHPFDALINHHSQSFYPIPLSRELLALNLSRAASTQPLDRLYAYAAPLGLLHYTDLRTNAAGYRAMIDVLKGRERDILAYVARNIARYVPPDIQLSRRVSFFVVDWSDGWGANDVTAVDLEYYKGDLERLVNVLVHETFHAAQGAVATAHPSNRPAPRTAADTAIQSAAQYLLIEGTANFIAPAIKRTPESAAAMADSGRALLERLAALAQAPGKFDRDAAQTILDRGVAGGGPFYWLGAAMATVVVERSGPQAIGKLLQGDGVDFMRTYVATTKRGGAKPSLLPPGIVALLDRQ